MTPRDAAGPPSRALQLGLLVIAAVVIVLGAIGALWSDSADLANHYALTARLSELWRLPAASDPSLGEMNMYPRSSHAMAAIVGSVFDSPLIGLHLVSLASIIALWACFIHWLRTLPGRLATRSLVALVVLLVLNRVVWRFDIHGREVVGSFFYAQLVGQAVLALALSALMALDRRGVEAPTRYALFVALAWFCAGIHALPALQLLGTFVLVVALEYLVQLGEGEGGRLRRALLPTAFVVAGAALLLRHPAFTAMVEISRNNGAFAPKHLGSIGAIAGYAVVVALASAAYVHRWWRCRAAGGAQALLLFKYLGLYGLAVAGLCLLQVVALKLGQGSEYAIRKHVFALNTVMLLALAAAPAWLAARSGRHVGGPAGAPRSFAYTYLLLPLLTVLAFHAVAPRRPASATVDLLKLERALLRDRDALAALAPGRFAYVLPGPGVSPTTAYLLTIGVLKSPRSSDSGSNALDILRGNSLSDWPSVGLVLQPGTLQPGQPASCLRPFPGLPFSLLDGPCMARAVARASASVRLVSGQPLPCTLTGFGEPEQSFTWTTATSASVECPVPELESGPPRQVTISTGAFLDRVAFQRVRVAVQGGGAAELRFDETAPHRLITLALPANPGPTCRIEFTLPDAVSPKDVGLSIDPRKLGLSVSRIEFK